MGPSRIKRDHQRSNSCANFRFRVKWGGRVVAGFSKLSALKSAAGLVQPCDGTPYSASRRSVGCTDHGSFTLEGGIIHDREFAAWANRVWVINTEPSSQKAPQRFPQEVTIELLNEAGQVAITFTVIGCWVSGYDALPEIDANGSTVVIQSLKLNYAGWLRTWGPKEPTGPA